MNHISQLAGSEIMEFMVICNILMLKVKSPWKAFSKITNEKQFMMKI